MLKRHLGRKHVFPAHAGMSPEIKDTGISLYSFPRSRGDEPVLEIHQEAVELFSPLTRG